MKTCSRCKETKALDAFPKHRRMRDGRASVCRECNKVLCAAKYEANKERYKRAALEWKAANKEKYREASRASSRARYQRDPEKHKQYAAAWIERNREKYLEMHRARKAVVRAADPEKHRESSRRWAANNPDKIADHDTRRRVAVKQAATKWDRELDAFVGVEAHRLKRLRRKMLGGEWHVDHVVPLRGKTVSGLHNAYNLAVIPGAENIDKRHYVWPDMPC